MFFRISPKGTKSSIWNAGTNKGKTKKPDFLSSRFKGMTLAFSGWD
jgi:hypothetical protein